MKKYLIFYIVAIHLIFLQACMSSRHYFQNKILIYNSVSGSGHTTRNAAFIDYYNDTINKIDYPFSLFEQYKESVISSDSSENKYQLPNIYPYSGVPFKFDRKGKSIYIGYSFKGDVFHKKYFEISNNDSVETSSFEYLCDTELPNNAVITKFRGDTVIKICGNQFSSWIFLQEYPYSFPSNSRSRVIYLEKRTLIPLQITVTYYRPDQVNPVSYSRTIDSVIKRPWNSATQKWNYPKCWKNGYSSIKAVQ